MKKAVGIIITISMIMCSCMVAWAANPIKSNGGTDAHNVAGSYSVTDIADKDGDGVPDTDTKDTSGNFTPDGDSNGIPDGDGTPDAKPDYDINNDNKPDKVPTAGDNIDWDGDGDVDADDQNANPSDSPNIDAPDAISPTGATYSVTITWGNLLYDYKVTGSTWDPSSHTYKNGTVNWVGRNGAASTDIVVANNSNVDVRVRYKFTPDAKFSALNGSFSPNMMKIENALGKPAGTAANATTSLSLAGDPGTNLDTDAKLGEVTIKIDYTII